MKLILILQYFGAFVIGVTLARNVVTLKGAKGPIRVGIQVPEETVSISEIVLLKSVTFSIRDWKVCR